MNLTPPPFRTGNDKEDLDKLYEWVWHTYEFLKYPAFHVIRLVPRASKSDRQEGDLYYDSDTDKATLGVAAAWETITSS